MTEIWSFIKQLPWEKVIYYICLTVICLVSVKLILILFDKFMKKSKTDTLVRTVLRVVLKAFLLSMAVIIVLGSMGVAVSSLVAMLSVVGVAFSLAIQGFLSNAFGGLQIISNKPFKTGDYIEVGADAGLVQEVGLFYTKLNTYDKKLIQIPNGKISNDTIVNYTSSNVRRVDFDVCVSYENEAAHVLSVMIDMLAAHPLVLSEEGLKPYAHVKEYRHSHICYTARAWCATQDYWTVYFDIMDAIQPTFTKHGVTFSYPHMNIHMMENRPVGHMPSEDK